MRPSRPPSTCGRRGAEEARSATFEAVAHDDTDRRAVTACEARGRPTPERHLYSTTIGAPAMLTNTEETGTRVWHAVDGGSKTGSPATEICCCCWHLAVTCA
eukprot:6890491-Prymnesium_polylepis.1